jgi:hypothetical protein
MPAGYFGCRLPMESIGVLGERLDVTRIIGGGNWSAKVHCSFFGLPGRQPVKQIDRTVNKMSEPGFTR